MKRGAGLAALFGLAACGRIDFDPLGGDARGATGDGRTFDAPAAGTWAIVSATGVTSTPVVIPATGAGDLIVVAIQTEPSITAVTDDAGNTYTAIPGANGMASGGCDVELWYSEDARAGATQLTIDGSAIATVVWEVAGIRTAGSLDTTATSSTAVPAAPLGAPITTSLTGDFVVSATVTSIAQITGIAAGSPFTADFTTNGNGWAHLTATGAAAALYQAQWNATATDIYCAGAAAFAVAP